MQPVGGGGKQLVRWTEPRVAGGKSKRSSIRAPSLLPPLHPRAMLRPWAFGPGPGAGSWSRCWESRWPAWINTGASTSLAVRVGEWYNPLAQGVCCHTWWQVWALYYCIYPYANPEAKVVSYNLLYIDTGGVRGGKGGCKEPETILMKDKHLLDLPQRR